MPDQSPPQHLIRAALVIGFLFALGVASLKILQPFLVAFLWAVIIVVASWPAMVWLQRRLGGRRWAAVSLLTLALLVLLILPLSLAITAAVVNAGEIADRVKNLDSFRLPALPAWITQLPFFGDKAIQLWDQVATAGLEGLLARLAPYAGAVTKGIVARASGFGFIIIEAMMALAFAALLYLSGEAAARVVQRIAARLAGPRGANAVVLATSAIRGVALGVGGTAVVQSVMTGIGLSLAGVPFAALLSGLAFVLCLVQIGTVPVLLPAVVWVFWSGDTGWGIFLLIWSIIIGTADNILRPMLIQRGVDLPLWLVLAGVVGGLLAFGLVGLFIGPVVLAVSSMLLSNWLDDGEGEFQTSLALQNTLSPDPPPVLTDASERGPGTPDL
ncbi:MAG: AI-2E family transporter YdiK [Ideonella sp.]